MFLKVIKQTKNTDRMVAFKVQSSRFCPVLIVPFCLNSLAVILRHVYILDKMIGWRCGWACGWWKNENKRMVGRRIGDVCSISSVVVVYACWINWPRTTTFVGNYVKDRHKWKEVHHYHCTYIILPQLNILWFWWFCRYKNCMQLHWNILARYISLSRITFLITIVKISCFTIFHHPLLKTKLCTLFDVHCVALSDL